MKKENKAIIEMLLCATLWSIAGIIIKLLPWNGFAVAGMRSLIAGATMSTAGVNTATSDVFAAFAAIA